MQVTDFLPPPVVALAQTSIRQLQGVAALPWGGYASVRFAADIQRIICSIPNGTTASNGMTSISILPDDGVTGMIMHLGLRGFTMGPRQRGAACYWAPKTPFRFRRAT